MYVESLCRRLLLTPHNLFFFDLFEHEPESAQSISKEGDWHKSKSQPQVVGNAENETSQILLGVLFHEASFCIFIMLELNYRICNAPSKYPKEC